MHSSLMFSMCVCVSQCNVLVDARVAVGMRLRGRDLEDSTVSWIPSVLGVQSVRLRLRLDRRDDRGRGLWQLVDLGEEAKSGQRIRDRTPPTCSQSKNYSSIAEFRKILNPLILNCQGVVWNDMHAWRGVIKAFFWL